MAYTSWRGVIGLIKPTHRPGPLEETIRLLPEGLGVMSIMLDVRRGLRDEYRSAVKYYEPAIEELVEHDVDLVVPTGAGPFIVSGYEYEVETVRAWEEKYKRPIITAGVNQINAMRALDIKRPLIVSHATGVLDSDRGDYFIKAGFDVQGQVVVPAESFERASQIPWQEVYAHTKRQIMKSPRTDGILIRGGAWRCLEAVELLERDLEIPVVHAITVVVWEVQKRLRIREPRQGCGILLSQLPAMV
jgi:maleate cis-trans isomerase